MSESLKTADIKYDDLTSEQKQVKQLDWNKKRFGVGLSTYIADPKYWNIDLINQGQERNYFHIPNQQEKLEWQADKKLYLIKSSTGATKSFKPMNVIALSQKYNNRDLIIPVYTEDEYNFLVNAGYKEMTQDDFSKGHFTLGKRFGKPIPFYKK